MSPQLGAGGAGKCSHRIVSSGLEMEPFPGTFSSLCAVWDAEPCLVRTFLAGGNLCAGLLGDLCMQDTC